MTEVRNWAAGAMLIAYSAAVALSRGTTRWILAAPLVAVPLLTWILRSPSAWLSLFFAASLLLPPLPVAIGNSGPHPALVFAALGLAAGIVRIGEWRFERDWLNGLMLALPVALAISVALAAVYSGPAIALASLARVCLVCISIYVFFAVRQTGGLSYRYLYWLGLGSAAFACVDFYDQFPAPAGFSAQYVWLESGVYRRAQGLFYEAGTLGNLCAFFLVMTAVALAQRVGNRFMLLLGGVTFGAALIFSYSRSSVLNVVAALGALLYLERARFRIGRLIAIVAGAIAIVYAAFPAFAQAWIGRLWASGTQIFSSSDRVLTGRIESWQILGHFLAQNPWHAIFGVGYKTLPYSDFIGQTVVADNMYLSLLVETGIIGLGVVLALSVAILRTGYRAAISGDSEKSFYGAWIFCFWAGQMVQMLSVDLLTFWRVLPLYFAVLAMAARR